MPASGGLGDDSRMRVTAALMILALVPVAACTGPSESGTTGIQCGPGTILVGSACLPAGGESSGGATTDASSSSGSEQPAETTAASTTGADSSSAASSESTGAPPPTVIELADAIIHDNPPDVASWPVTTTITQLDFRDDGVHVVFSKQDGPDRWPDIVPPGWDGPLQYTLGLVELIDGQWHASAAMQYWYGLEAQGGNVALDDQIAVNWYYDGRWGEMAGYQPAQGETLGVFVVAGNVRGVLDGSQSPVQERSNVVVVPMPGVEGASHSF